jgi:hypothetical protein
MERIPCFFDKSPVRSIQQDVHHEKVLAIIFRGAIAVSEIENVVYFWCYVGKTGRTVNIYRVCFHVD